MHDNIKSHSKTINLDYGYKISFCVCDSKDEKKLIFVLYLKNKFKCIEVCLLHPS